MKHEDIKIGQIIPVAEFNKLAEDKWRRRCDESRGTNNPLPYIGFYVFSNRKGNYKTRGFVLKVHNDSYQYFKLKRNALRDAPALLLNRGVSLSWKGKKWVVA